MRFSTIISSALLVGFAAALPTPGNQGYNMDSSSASSTVSSAASSYTGSSKDKSSSSSSYDSSYNNKDNSYSMDSSYDNSKSSYDSTSDSSYESTSSADSTSTSSADNSSYTSSVDDSYNMGSSYTSSAEMSSSTSSYGSGYNNWGNSGYNDCVQQCLASYAPPASTWTPPTSTQSSDDGSYHGSSGTNGVTHTVMVAPTNGVFRYVPFAVNASVGDTVKFYWVHGPHTVTKSSALEMCNKTDDAPFASGVQNASFTFTQVVNTTDPTYFYCGVATHCQKGMFGMINPASGYMAPSSVGQMMPDAVSNSSDMANNMVYANMLTKGNDKAAAWGSNIILDALPPAAHTAALENVLYSRAFLGSNPTILKDNGFIDLSGSNLKFPADLSDINNAVDSGSAVPPTPQSSSAPAAPAASSASSAPASSATPEGKAKDNGAASTVASSALFGAVAFAAAVLAF